MTDTLLKQRLCTPQGEPIIRVKCEKCGKSFILGAEGNDWECGSCVQRKPAGKFTYEYSTQWFRDAETA